MSARRWFFALALGGLTAVPLRPAPLGAQDVAPPQSPSETAPAPISPRGAFLRAVLVPGWGHAALGSYTRGGFYFALETATAYAFLRTRSRLSEVRGRAALQERVLRSRYAAEGLTDPEEIATRLDEDQTLRSLENLVASREGQREDLVAFGIFLLFLTGADAYVSAHLADFPTPIDMQASAEADGRAEVTLRVHFPR